MLILNEGDCLQFAGMDHVHILTMEIYNINKNRIFFLEIIFITYSVFPKKINIYIYKYIYMIPYQALFCSKI